MVNYTVRVEVHLDDYDYDQMHEAMEVNGFVRWIRKNGDPKLALPPAEYSIRSEKTIKQILERARKSAHSATGDDEYFSLLVTSSKEARESHNLDEFE